LKAPIATAASEASAATFGSAFGHEAEGKWYQPMAELAGAGFGAGIPAVRHAIPGFNMASRAVKAAAPYAKLPFSSEGRQQLSTAARDAPQAASRWMKNQPLSPTSPGIRQGPGWDRSGTSSPSVSDLGTWRDDVLQLNPENISGARAQSSVLGRVANREESLARINQGALSEHTNLSQLTGDPNLVNEYEAIIKLDPEKWRIHKEETEKAAQDLSRRAFLISKGSLPENTPLPESVFKLIDDLEAHARGLGRDQPRTEIAMSLAGDSDTSYTQNKAIEKALWETGKKNNENAPLLPTEELLDDWGDIINNIPKAEKDEVPQYILKLFPPEKAPEADGLFNAPKADGQDVELPGRMSRMFSLDGEHPIQIHSAISMLRETARDNPGTRAAVIAGNLANRAQLLLDTSDPTFDNARAFTKAWHQVLDKNKDIGRLFRPSGAPGSARQIVNHPTEILETLGIGTQATTSANANTIRDLLDLSAFTGGMSPEEISSLLKVKGVRQGNSQTVTAINDHFYQRFLEVTDNLTDWAKGDQFLAKHRDLWDAKRFPELVSLRDDLGKAVRLSKRRDQVGGLENTVDQIFRNKRPLMLLRSKMRLGTTLGESDGSLWKEAIIDHFTRIPSGKGGAGDLKETAGQDLLNALNNPKTREVFNAIFNNSELEGEYGLIRVAQEWRGVGITSLPEGQRGGTLSGTQSVSGTALQKIIALASFGSRAVGAGIGRKISGWLGGGTIQTPAAGSTLVHNKFSNYLDKSLNETLSTGYTNKTVMRDLLTPTDQLDVPGLNRIWIWAKEKFGVSIALDLKNALAPFAIASVKSQVPTIEEQQQIIDSFQDQFKPSFDPNSQFLQRSNITGPPEITRLPESPSGRRIGPPRR